MIDPKAWCDRFFAGTPDARVMTMVEDPSGFDVIRTRIAALTADRDEALALLREARELIDYAEGAFKVGHFSHRPDDADVGLVERWPSRAASFLARLAPPAEKPSRQTE